MAKASPTPFGQLLRRHRLAAGLSQEDLAERAGLSIRGISDLERGARSIPRLETIRLLADALGLDPDERAALIAATRPDPTETAVPDPTAAPRATSRPVSRLPVRPTPLVGFFY